MLLEVVAGAIVSLVLLVGIVVAVLRRRPLLFVADKLPRNLHSGPDDVDDLLTGADDSVESSRDSAAGLTQSAGVDEAGIDRDQDELDAGGTDDAGGFGDIGDTSDVAGRDE